MCYCIVIGKLLQAHNYLLQRTEAISWFHDDRFSCGQFITKMLHEVKKIFRIVVWFCIKGWISQGSTHLRWIGIMSLPLKFLQNSEDKIQSQCNLNSLPNIYCNIENAKHSRRVESLPFGWCHFKYFESSVI